MPTLYKTNNQITAREVRLIGEDGKQIGVLARDIALDFALGQGADLVLIGENAQPPVAKIIDYKKFLYQQEKKERDAKKTQKSSGIKEVRVGGPFAAPADVEARIRKTRELLLQGYLVRVVVKFSGRQLAHPEFGHRIVDQFKTALEGQARLDRESRLEGKLLVTIFSPSK